MQQGPWLGLDTQQTGVREGPGRDGPQMSVTHLQTLLGFNLHFLLSGWLAS